VIRGELVDLRPFWPADIERAERLANEPDHNGTFGTFAFEGVGSVRRRFEQDGFISDDHGRLVVVDKSGQTVGDVSYVAVFHGPSSANVVYNIGIVIDAAHRRRGYASDGLALLARYLFEAHTVERLEASIDVENIGAQRAIEHAGFAREGVLRHAQWRAGAWRDVCLYSKLRGE
jgi:RimJ/RimL family protein N-acetyltransferase